MGKWKTLEISNFEDGLNPDILATGEKLNQYYLTKAAVLDHDGYLIKNQAATLTEDIDGSHPVTTFLPFVAKCGTHLFLLHDDYLYEWDRTDPNNPYWIEYAAFKTARTGHLTTDIELFNGKLFIASGDKICTYDGTTLIQTTLTCSRLRAAHNRLYITDNADLDQIKYTTDGVTFTTIAAPGLTDGSLKFNPLNGDIIYGLYGYNGNSWYQHNLQIPTDNSYRIVGFGKLPFFLGQLNSQFGYYDGITFHPIPILEKLAASFSQPVIFSYIPIGEKLLISFGSSYTASSRNYMLDPKKNTIQLINLYGVDHFGRPKSNPEIAFYDPFKGTNNYLTISTETVTAVKYLFSYHLRTDSSSYDVTYEPSIYTQNLTFGDPSIKTIMKSITIHYTPAANTSFRIYADSGSGSYSLIGTITTTTLLAQTIVFNPCKKFDSIRFEFNLHTTGATILKVRNISIKYKKEGDE